LEIIDSININIILVALFNTIWEDIKVPDALKKQLIVKPPKKEDSSIVITGEE